MAKKAVETQDSPAELPWAKRRAELLEEMHEPTRKVAQEIAKRRGAIEKGTVMLMWDIGAMMTPVVNKAGVYGQDAVTQVASYVYPDEKPKNAKQRLYNMKTVADEFDRKTIETESAIPMSNGEPLVFKHFLEVSKVKDVERRPKIFAKIRSACLSGNATKLWITSGDEALGPVETGNGGNVGRPPAVPEDPAQALKKAEQLGKNTGNYLEAMTAQTYPQIDELSPDVIDLNLLERMQAFRDQLKATKVLITRALQEAVPIEAHIKTVLNARADAELKAEMKAEAVEAKAGKAPKAPAKAAAAPSKAPAPKAATKPAPKKKAAKKPPEEPEELPEDDDIPEDEDIDDDDLPEDEGEDDADAEDEESDIIDVESEEVAEDDDDAIFAAVSKNKPAEGAKKRRRPMPV